MRNIFLAIMLTVSLPGMVAAQAITGEKAETAKKEILKIEDEKVAGLLKGGSEPVDWIKQYDAEDVAQTNIDGSSPTQSRDRGWTATGGVQDAFHEAGWASLPRV